MAMNIIDTITINPICIASDDREMKVGMVDTGNFIFVTRNLYFLIAEAPLFIISLI